MSDIPNVILSAVTYRVGGGVNPPPRNSEGPKNPTKFKPIVKTVAEFRTPTPQDVPKKAVKF